MTIQLPVKEMSMALSGHRGIQICGIASAVPEHCIDQAVTRDIILASAPEFRSHAAVFQNTGVKTRFSCVPVEWHTTAQDWSSRAAVYRSAAVKLLEDVSRQCVDRAGISLSDIEAIVTVSTTGLAVPSLDAMLANRLDLSAAVERLPVFGLGCAGGVSGLARSAQLARSLPAGNVLLLVVELCTINCRTSDRTIPNFISAALFGDGAAAVLLRRRSGRKSRNR